MIVAKIEVSGVRGTIVYRDVVPAGIIGADIEISYTDDIWRDLRKTVVFRGAVTKDVVTDRSIVTIPPEVVEAPNTALSVGVYGVDAMGNIAVPTLWAELGYIRPAADPSGDTTTAPSIPVWAQIKQIADEAKQQAQSVRDDADTGRFDGAQGAPGADGKTPEYGVDYGTPEQISEIAQSAAEILQPEVEQIKNDLVKTESRLSESIADIDNTINNITDKPRSVIDFSVESFVMLNAQTAYTLSIPSTDSFSYYHADYNNHYYGFVFPTTPNATYDLTFDASADFYPQCLIMTNFAFPNKPDVLSNDYVIYSFLTVDGRNTCRFTANGAETVMCFKQMYNMHNFSVSGVNCSDESVRISIKPDRLPKASNVQSGAVIVGDGIDVDDGVISITHATRLNTVRIINPYVYAINGAGDFYIYNDGVFDGQILPDEYCAISPWANVIDTRCRGQRGRIGIQTHTDQKSTLKPETIIYDRFGNVKKFRAGDGIVVKFANKPAINLPLNILFVGDSLVASGMLTKSFRDIMTELGYDGKVNLIGRRHAADDATNKFEATGGYSWPNYVLNPTELPSGYPDNYFWHNGKVDIGYYISTYCGGVNPDYIICNNGWNNRVNPNYYPRYSFNDIDDMACAWIDSVNAALPDCHIIINNIHYGNRNYPYPTADYRKFAVQLTTLYADIASRPEYAGFVRFCDVAPYFDGSTGMYTVSQQINRFVDDTEQVIGVRGYSDTDYLIAQPDYIHPGNDGYKMHGFADAMCLLYDAANK